MFSKPKVVVVVVSAAAAAVVASQSRLHDIVSLKIKHRDKESKSTNLRRS